jgi:two-component system, chemotaxis family, sensor kinase CheA
MMQAHQEIYREEAYDLLGELETSLLALEEVPGDAELIGRVFRALHTIKGSGGMFGFDDIAAFTHEVETVFELVRSGKMAVNKTLLDLTLAAGDQIRRMLDGSDVNTPADTARGKAIIDKLKELVPERDEYVNVNPKEAPLVAADARRDTTYRISLRLDCGVFSRGTNPIFLLNELRELGECQVIAHTESIPELEDFDPEECHTSWDVILTTQSGINAIKDVFIFVEDECEVRIDVVGADEAFGGDFPCPRLGEILIECGEVSQEDVQTALGKQKRIGELLMDAGAVEPSKVESALAEQEHVKAVHRKQQKEELTSNIKVPAERLDTLVNLVGELVTVQARLSQAVASLKHAGLLSISEEVERLTAELRDNTLSIRMVPIGTTFSKFKRLVRDLANELRKDVALVTEGGETELDKTVIERLNDPLVHLIRNCIDHGIEPPDLREAAGKPKLGTVHLSATHSGASVLIHIADDGAGLDVEAIRAKEAERGAISAGAELSEQEVFALIFAPGFSTARQVTNVSGRGVGMDVVKRSIDALRGSIEVSSKRGVGTTITLKLPLTLAIIDGLLVKVGEGYFVLPLSVVEECVELTREDVARAHGQHITYVRGGIVPYIRLRERFLIDGKAPSDEQIVITEVGGGRIGFAVDKVIGEHQTVIKNLGRMYRNVEGISGATILGDGTVALIMDVPKLVQGVELLEAMTHAPHLPHF